MRRLAAIGLVALLGCKGPMAKIDAVRDALEKDDAAAIKSATAGYPTCADTTPAIVAVNQPSPRDKGCLSDIANALGSQKGFAPQPPDQAAAATVALLLVRDGRGDLVSHVDLWLSAMKSGKGAGFDALRLAVARKMVETAPLVGRKIDTDAQALETMKGIASAIPGACPTYWMLGSGVEPSTIPPVLSADHSACVHQDLRRREGPGGAYGAGTFRAVEGALAEWREAERALRLGVAQSSPTAKATIERELAIIEPATRANETKKIDATVAVQTLTTLGELHAEAGIMLWKPKDAGADGAADAGAGASDAGATH
jgi:hypothetical protein